MSLSRRSTFFLGAMVWLSVLSWAANAVSVPIRIYQASGGESAAKGPVQITFAQPFKPGDIPSGRTAIVRNKETGETVPSQVEIKASHPDGSARHAVVTVELASAPARNALALELVPAAMEKSGTPSVNPRDLLGHGLGAAVELRLGDEVYVADLAQAMAAASPVSWLSGPLVSERIMWAPLKNAAGKVHPHLAVRFGIRAYAGLKRARVEVVVENTWAYEPDPGNFTYDAVIRVANEKVYEKAALKHYHQARWRKIFWWGGDPRIEVAHDPAYLIESRAVPNYDQGLKFTSKWLNVSEKQRAALAEPIGPGVLDPRMANGGGRPEIGPLPAWAVTYLLSQSPAAKAITLGSGDLAGSWPIHYRDKDTRLPVSLDDYPYMTLAGNKPDAFNKEKKRSEFFPPCDGDCSSPLVPDSAHHPSLAYLPYLVTGDYYYLEELELWANYLMLRPNPPYRRFSQALMKGEQVRGQAWSLRTIGHAAYIVPDKDPFKHYFVSRLQNNINFYLGYYLDTTTPKNSLGFIDDQVGGYALVYGDGTGLGPWQDDFVTWAIGDLVRLGFQEAKPLLQWKARFPVGRMLGPGFCWIHGASYSLKVRDTKISPFYSTFKEIYAANRDPQIPCASDEMAQQLKLKVGEMTGYAGSDEGFPAIMQPALAAAVDAAVPGAVEAWKLFMARNVKPAYERGPQFDILPLMFTNTPAVAISPSTDKGPATLPPRLPSATDASRPSSAAEITPARIRQLRDSKRQLGDPAKPASADDRGAGSSVPGK